MEVLEQTELDMIEEICGTEYADRCRAIQERRLKNCIRIVNTGMVSSGKSSLYNVLINYEGEFFPTGAARTTTEASCYEYKNISYIDTPGIDVRTEDDAIAFQTIMESDIILMIHNIRTGPLNRSETEWLKRIVQGMSSPEMCAERIVFVVSWKDTREKEEGYAELIQDMQQTVKEIVGVEIPFFEVSVKKFQIGLEKGQDVLIRNSGIQELKDYLEGYASRYSGMKSRIDRQESIALMNRVAELLHGRMDECQTRMEVIKSQIHDQSKARKTAWRHVWEYFRTQKNRLSRLSDEYNNM